MYCRLELWCKQMLQKYSRFVKWMIGIAFILFHDWGMRGVVVCFWNHDPKVSGSSPGACNNQPTNCWSITHTTHSYHTLSASLRETGLLLIISCSHRGDHWPTSEMVIDQDGHWPRNMSLSLLWDCTSLQNHPMIFRDERMIHIIEFNHLQGVEDGATFGNEKASSWRGTDLWGESSGYNTQLRWYE